MSVTSRPRIEAQTPRATSSRARRWLPKIASVWVGIPLLLLATIVVVNTQGSYNIFVFNTCILAAIGAIALNLQMGTAGQISMGNSAFLMVGAFVTAAAAEMGVGYPFSIAIGAVVSGLVGLLVGIPAARLGGMYFALSTVAAFYIVHYIASTYQSRTVGEAGFFMDPVYIGLPTQLQASWAWLLMCVLAVVILVATALSHGKVARALRVIRDHEAAAPAFAIGVMRYKLLVFGVGFGLIGLQGGLYAYFFGQVTVGSFTLLMAIQYLAMIIIGGADSVAGSVVGAFVVTMLPVIVTESLSGQLGADSSVKGPQIALIIYGVLVIWFVTRSAGGIVGWVRSGMDRVGQRIARRRSRSGPTGLARTEPVDGP